MTSWSSRISALAVGASLIGCARPQSRQDNGFVYTLYRSSAADDLAPDPSKPRLRIHVATFDAEHENGADSGPYNSANCDRARGLFQSQPLVSVNYWCEKGRYRE